MPLCMEYVERQLVSRPTRTQIEKNIQVEQVDRLLSLKLVPEAKRIAG